MYEIARFWLIVPKIFKTLRTYEQKQHYFYETPIYNTGKP